MSALPPTDQGTSTRPYLIRALHEWCSDNGFTPYIAVYVDASVAVPMEYVKNHEIVLNVGFEATSGLKLGNQRVEFKARFGGSSRDISVPVDHVVAIYARENGQGMAFPAPIAGASHGHAAVAEAQPQTAAAHDAPDAPGTSGLRLATAQPHDAPAAEDDGADHGADDEPPPPEPAGGSRPVLKRIK